MQTISIGWNSSTHVVPSTSLPGGHVNHSQVLVGTYMLHNDVQGAEEVALLRAFAVIQPRTRWTSPLLAQPCRTARRLVREDGGGGQADKGCQR